ncbi:MAG TPA: glycosyltransferase family 87 protein [Thermomicrobiales bacterium]|nr:glycosyltransferase family 87 protein [Thermomicrobiales bacterium]
MDSPGTDRDESRRELGRRGALAIRAPAGRAAAAETAAGDPALPGRDGGRWRLRLLGGDQLGFAQVAALALAMHLAAFWFIATYLSVTFDTSDLAVYFSYGQRMVGGLVPYRDFVMEYPPLAAPLFWLPARFARDLAAYEHAFLLEVIAFDLAGVGAALWALRRFAPRLSAWGILLAQPLWLIAIGRGLAFTRFDLAPAALVLLALVLFALRHERWAWGVLGLATALKLYPAVLAPLFVIARWRRRAWRQAAGDALVFAAAILLPSLAVTRGHPSALAVFFTYHLDRGLEIETVSASLLMALHLVGYPVSWTIGHNAAELVAPQAPLFAALALPLTVVALGVVYVVAWRREPALGAPPDPARRFDWLVRLSAAALLAFMLAGKVLSPQYLLWLYPLAAVLTGRRTVAWWALFLVALALGHWIYPLHWVELVSFQPPAIAALIARNGILLILGAMLLAPRASTEARAAAAKTSSPAGRAAAVAFARAMMTDRQGRDGGQR